MCRRRRARSVRRRGLACPPRSRELERPAVHPTAWPSRFGRKRAIRADRGRAPPGGRARPGSGRAYQPLPTIDGLPGAPRRRPGGRSATSSIPAGSSRSQRIVQSRRDGWTWASSNPGGTVRPRSSTTRVDGPMLDLDRASAPTRRSGRPGSRSPRPAGRAASAVYTAPPGRTRSAGRPRHRRTTRMPLPARAAVCPRPDPPAACDRGRYAPRR